MHAKSALLALSILLATGTRAQTGISAKETDVPTPTGTSSDAAGKQIFQARCAACHNVNTQVVGPALAGIDKRRDINWIIRFVHSSQTVIKAGDPYADDLFVKFNKTVMPDHPDLTDAQIRELVSYVVGESKNIPAEKQPFAKPYTISPDYQPLSLHNYGFIAGYLGLVVLLMFVMLLAVRVKEVERRKQ